MDSTQYVAQLATFSQVEQSVQTNTKLDQIMSSSALSQADALIGRSITSADGNTTGTVASVRLASNGLIAVLQDGTEVAVGPGVSVKAAS
jgi:flagellar basal-body rod modification protein FlgD